MTTTSIRLVSTSSLRGVQRQQDAVSKSAGGIKYAGQTRQRGRVAAK